ncbi:NAD(P)/FAD-dependent oxidoreductase [Blastochloris sulfoviridis]|uniref:NAD(P)/FAD-dependent oxidoreductase n=1 Tax=Blastochloris sulfoviridis TaxID=50712 RepID=UPI0014783A2B|nr:FAD-binding oxidoreductase [Blastochloris sulfoviridis]
MRVDVVVLGAGIVGASAAAHLARRGVRTALVDRRAPGKETSFGNAGLIEPSGVVPMAFPRDLATLAKAALGLLPQSNYHLSALPALLPFLWRYRQQSTHANRLRSGVALFPLLSRAVEAHRELLTAAGAAHLLHPTGFYRLFRAPESFERYLSFELAVEAGYGSPYEILSPAEVAARDPAIRPVFHKAVWWKDAVAVRSPGEAVTAIAGLVPRHGGLLLTGDARSLRRDGTGFRVDTGAGPLEADTVVVALGPWSTDVTEQFKLKLPFAVKRGYHMHFEPGSDAKFDTPFVDMEGGYFLAPMPRGIRLTTGVEFALRDAPPTPVQIERTRPMANELVALGPPLDPEPWMGRRPCLPDSLPVIGRLTGAEGVVLAFGHQHLGLTLGPITGQLVADIVTGTAPVVDPAPYRPERFA